MQLMVLCAFCLGLLAFRSSVFTNGISGSSGSSGASDAARRAKAQLKEFHVARKDGGTIAVCAVFPTILDFGGVEMWWWSLCNAVTTFICNMTG